MKHTLLLLSLAIALAACSSADNRQDQTSEIKTVTVTGNKPQGKDQEVVVIQGKDLEAMLNSRWAANTDSALSDSKFSKDEKLVTKMLILAQAGSKCSGGYSVKEVAKGQTADPYQEIWVIDMCGIRKWQVERGEKFVPAVKEIK